MKLDRKSFKDFHKQLEAELKDSEEYYNRLYPLLGQIASNFARLEWELNQSFALAVNDSDLEIGLSIADQLSFNQVIKLFQTIAQRSTIERSKKFSSRLKSLTQDLEKSAKLRNDSLHCSFGYVLGSSGSFLKTRARIKSKEKHRGSPMIDPFPDLVKADNHILKTISKLLKFTTDYI